jgi:hypothetical protein
MTENVIRFADYEQKSRNPDAVSPRDPSDSALIVILPQVISRPIREQRNPRALQICTTSRGCNCSVCSGPLAPSYAE